MAEIILVTGGSRSGKSDFARNLAESVPGVKAFVATCPEVDEETKIRIQRHQAERDPTIWTTVEEPLRLAETCASLTDHPVILVDCLTLWMSNLMFDAERRREELREEEVGRIVDEVTDACRSLSGRVIFVTNEVGWGIVPENAYARRFRDLAGRCNRRFADAADAVVLVVCGYPVFVKGSSTL